MRYFRWRWQDDRGDEHADWGPSTWLWAIDDDGWSVDQRELYDGGQVLHYDTVHAVDEYGMLADQRADLDDEDAEGVEELSEAEYRSVTGRLTAMNR